MTTPYHVLIAPEAMRRISLLSSKYQKILIKLIEALAVNPRPPGVKKVEGMADLYTHKIDHIRILYKIEENEVIFLVIK